MEAAVLLVTFNRPENTRKVFEKLKAAKVSKLFLFNDGPREGNIKDIEARKAIFSLSKEVDWNCELSMNFPEKNRGCGLGVSSAISWAFEKEDRLIILEDDCVPSLSFFSFCNDMLELYKNDTRVWTITGRSHHSGSKYFKDQDFIFSKNSGHCWGWATWKRCWNHFTFDLDERWANFVRSGGFENVFFSKEEAVYFTRVYNKVFNDKKLSTHAWSLHFAFILYSNGGLSIVPSQNLIENIGKIGVHTKMQSSFHELKAFENFVIKRLPLLVINNREYDYLHYKKHWRKLDPPLLNRIFNRIIRISKKK